MISISLSSQFQPRRSSPFTFTNFAPHLFYPKIPTPDRSQRGSPNSKTKPNLSPPLRHTQGIRLPPPPDQTRSTQPPSFRSQLREDLPKINTARFRVVLPFHDVLPFHRFGEDSPKITPDVPIYQFRRGGKRGLKADQPNRWMHYLPKASVVSCALRGVGDRLPPPTSHTLLHMRHHPFGSPLSNPPKGVSEPYASLIVNRICPCDIRTFIDEFDLRVDTR